MRKLALLCLILFAASADAGPIVDRIRARREQRLWPTQPPAARPPQACFNCKVCGDKCQCFGGGYYCADGKCPVKLPAGPRCADGKCYPGK